MMDVKDAWRAATQWVPFAARTAAYGLVSVSFGPLTSDRRASLWAMRRWCQTGARGLNLAVEIEGLENAPKSGAFVYCSNHQSMLDVLILGGCLPGDFKWAAKRSLMNIPFLGWHLKLAGHVPVDRGAGPRVVADVIARFVEVLQAGKPLLVFPEGTRSEDGFIRPFKSGGFYAAVRAGVPVVPVAIEGATTIMRKHALDSGEVDQKRAVKVRIGTPILPKAEGREAKRVADLKDRTFAAVVELNRQLGGLGASSKPDDASAAAATA